MRLAKWHGLGNDYLIIDEAELPSPLEARAVSLLCDRHRGVGADGLLIRAECTGNVPDAVARMRVLNPDGSEAEMCGNGIRMFALYLGRCGLVREPEFTVETLAGPVRPRVLGRDRVRVDMGLARFRSANIALGGSGDVLDMPVVAGGKEYRFTFVDVGNPHCILFVPDVDAVDLSVVGPLLERHPLFPNRTNVEFVCMEPDSSARMRVWERGAGETQACGTGATAVGAACVRLGLSESPVTVHLPGGDLTIEVETESGTALRSVETAVPGSPQGLGALAGALAGQQAESTAYRVFMTGPAEEVFVATLSSELMCRLGWGE